MNAISLNNLWSYLQGLSLTASNQRWLGERLIEASNAAQGKSADVAALRVRHHGKALSDIEIAAHNASAAKPRSHSSRDFLKGLTLPQGTTDRQLINDYLAEKYGL